ncbi:MAG: SDR family oxidoreductase [Candidatus Obscuribacterales bacterium]|jgi:thioester reductase-like protein|nr:SDR family oxidoreductase [Candidatus Obscuribacterales bacterium]
MSNSILITGGNGYLGLRLAQALLQQTDYSVQLWIHWSTDEDRKAKSEPLNEIFKEAISDERLTICGGELSSEKPFGEIDPATIKQIIHSAAVTRFTVEEDVANNVNVEGTKKMLDFAGRCPNLEAIQLLSTVYASGLRTGMVKEEILSAGSLFSNHYERSKWESELLASQRKDLPVNIIRISTLISDDPSGVVSQQNAFHNTLKLFYYGLLSLFPGEKNTPLYFVTGDFVVDAIMAIFNCKQTGKIYHVCHRASDTATLEQLVDSVFDTFGAYPDFKVRRVMKPLWADVESFQLLNDGMGSLSGGVVAQAVSSVAPFSRQLFAAKDFDNSNLRSVMPSYSAPDPLMLINNTARYLADTKWGRQMQHVH